MIPQTTLPERDLSVVECRALWLAVIERAVLDMTSPKSEAERVQARAWIFNAINDADFRLACDYAGLDAEWVREKVGRSIDNVIEVAA